MYHRILLVEDEALFRRLIARNLTARGHLVREAATASEGVHAVLLERPDLMLLDLNLPDASGWDVLRELRTHDVDVCTAIVSAVRIVPSRLAEFHPVAYLSKPFPLETLLRLVRGDSVAPQPVDEKGTLWLT